MSEAPAIVSPPAAREPERTSPAPHARVAIIFDDAGYSIATAREVMALGRPVTMSVLPHLPFSTPIAQEAAFFRRSAGGAVDYPHAP